MINMDWRRVMSRRRLVLAAAAALGAITAGRAQGGIAYTLTDLGTLPGAANSAALALNDYGDVAGASGTDAFVYHNGVMQDLGNLGLSTYADGINDSGQVVGTVSHTPLSPQPVQDVNGKMQIITQVNPGSISGINNSGTIVGQDLLAGPGAGQAYTLNNGVLKELGTLGGSRSSATAISNAGLVTGFAFLKGDQAFHGFLYSGGQMIDIGTMGGMMSEPMAINDKGEIVGLADVGTAPSQFTHAFLYSDGKMTDIGALVQATFNSSNSGGRGINDSDEVIGNFQAQGSSVLTPFFYSDGTLVLLQSLVSGAPGYTLTDAEAINNLGQIAAIAAAPGGQSHAVLLTPVATANAAPLPAAVWSVLAVAPLVLWARRRAERSVRPE